MTTVENIKEEVSRHFRVSREALDGPSRRQHVALARQTAMYLVRQFTNLSYPAIGECFHRDHSTVIHACQSIARRRRNGFGATIAALEQELAPVPAIFHSRPLMPDLAETWWSW